MQSGWQERRVLITARTYPSPAKRGVEVSCVGGITEGGEWIRLFPVPYRFLDNDKRFHKYQWISVLAKKKPSDPRPESYEINIESIRVLGEPLPTAGSWAERRAWIDPLVSPSLCDLQNRWERDRAPTLGVFRPGRIARLEIRPVAASWSPEQAGRLQQQAMFGTTPDTPLEKLPYDFRYHFRCDSADCNGHSLKCVDWEMGQAYRRWRETYGDLGWEEKFRQRFEFEMQTRFDTHFYVGTVNQHPGSWIVVGLFYPLPRPALDEETAPTLF